MKKFFLASVFLSLFLNNIFSQVTQNDNYQFFIDLNNVENDQLTIELITPKILSEKVLYKLPAMVPGTYRVYDFGRFVSDLKAFDNMGNELGVNKTDANTWEVSNASALYKIVYKVNDTFDDPSGVNPIFEPVGTSIQKDTIFVINNHGFFGYLDDYIDNDYILSFTKPLEFYGSTSLLQISKTEANETYTAEDYQFLVDNPIFFNKPDTTSINFDEAKVLISVYSPGKGITAQDFSAKMKSLLSAIRNYLGGKLPADRYTFLYYFTDKQGVSGSFGALEHSYSSLYFMPDVPEQAKSFMVDQMQSTIAHEFYHIVTPLNLHSEEIGNFDFNNPVMSEHLWLYEGVTEYQANYIQLREGLISLKEYFEDVEKKLNGAGKFNDTLPFTEMSKGALDKYISQYLNVYQKGALIGLCLDILIRDETNDQLGLQDVINKLLEKYGKEKSFRDEDLIAEIVALTSPRIKEFFDRYVDGPEKIPYDKIFDKIGVKIETKPYTVIDLGGGVEMGFNQETFRLKIGKIENPDNKFLKDLGIRKGDELVSLNGSPVTYFNIKEAFGSLKNQIKKGDDFEIVIARLDPNGVEKKETLKAKVSETKTAYDYKLTLIDKVSEKQLRTRSAWLGK